jgi:phenylacetate-CoA ligase
LWGSALDVERFRSWSGRLRRLANREHLFNAHDLSDATCRTFAHRMARVGIEGIHGYPNAIHRVARQVLDQGIEIPLRFVLTTAETLLPDRRAVIEEAFGCPVFDYYGSRETSMVSQECPSHGGYHISIDNGAIEIVRDGRAVEPGEMGQVLVTDFRNRAMPLIRYAIGDVARAAAEPCACGRPFPVFRHVEGRVSDMFRLRDGQVRTPLLLTSLIYPDAGSWGYPTPEVLNILQWQMIQEAYETFTIRLVLETPAPPETYGYLDENFRRYVTPRARVRIEIVDEIPATGDGKRRPIVSRIVEASEVADLAGGSSLDPG